MAGTKAAGMKVAGTKAAGKKVAGTKAAGKKVAGKKVAGKKVAGATSKKKEAAGPGKGVGGKSGVPRAARMREVFPDRLKKVPGLRKLERVLGRGRTGEINMPDRERYRLLSMARRRGWTELDLPRPLFPLSMGSAGPDKVGYPTTRDPLTGEKRLARWSSFDRWRAPAHGMRRTIAWRKHFRNSGGSLRQIRRTARRKLEHGNKQQRNEKREKALASGWTDPLETKAEKEHVERVRWQKQEKKRAGPGARSSLRRTSASTTRSLSSASASTLSPGSLGAARAMLAADPTPQKDLRPFRDWKNEGKWPKNFIPPRGGWAASPGNSRFEDPLNDVDQWLNVGAQWGPRSPAPGWAGYMLGRRGMAIIDLDQTLAHLRRAGNVMRDVIEGGGHVLIVNPREHLNDMVQKAADQWGVSVIHGMVPNGLWTNWKQVGLSLERYRTLIGAFDGRIDDIEENFQEVIKFRKMHALWGGVVGSSPPDLVVSMDVAMTHPVTRECWHRGVPLIGFGDGSLASARSKMGTMIPYPVPINVENEFAMHAALNYINPKYSTFRPYKFGLAAPWEQKRSVAEIRGTTYRPKRALPAEEDPDSYHVPGHAGKDAWLEGLPVDDLMSDGTRKLADERGTMGNMELEYGWHATKEPRTYNLMDGNMNPDPLIIPRTPKMKKSKKRKILKAFLAEEEAISEAAETANRKLRRKRRLLGLSPPISREEADEGDDDDDEGDVEEEDEVKREKAEEMVIKREVRKLFGIEDDDDD